MNGADAAKTFFDAMKGQPLALGLIVCNFGLLGYLYYEGVAAHAERKTEMEMLYQNRTEVGKLLAQCMPGPGMPNAVGK